MSWEVFTPKPAAGAGSKNAGPGFQATFRRSAIAFSIQNGDGRAHPEILSDPLRTGTIPWPGPDAKPFIAPQGGVSLRIPQTVRRARAPWNNYGKRFH